MALARLQISTGCNDDSLVALVFSTIITGNNSFMHISEPQHNRKTVDGASEHTTTHRNRWFNSAFQAIFHFLSSSVVVVFLQNQLYQKILSGLQSECQTVWILIRPDIMSGLIWVQTVSLNYRWFNLAFQVISLFCRLLLLLFFFKIIFIKKLFQDYNQSVKQCGSRSGPTFVGPDLGPNCFHRLSVEVS